MQCSVLQECVMAVKPGWRGEVQSLMEVGWGAIPVEFSRVTAVGMKLFLNLLVRERRTL